MLSLRWLTEFQLCNGASCPHLSQGARPVAGAALTVVGPTADGDLCSPEPSSEFVPFCLILGAEEPPA